MKDGGEWQGREKNLARTPWLASSDNQRTRSKVGVAGALWQTKTRLPVLFGETPALESRTVF